MKGLFTQGVSVLTSHPPALDDLAEALKSFGNLQKVTSSNEWPVGSSHIIIPFRPEVNGSVVVDVVDLPWPDHMGDPTAEPTLFAAWLAGHFGPFAYPGSLQRATQQCWHWREASSAVTAHTSFVRLKCTYSIGASSSDMIRPPDYDPLAELQSLTSMIRAIARVSSALCYFNPNGEVLLSSSGLERSIQIANDAQVPALTVWTNTRLYSLQHQASGWLVQDTVGLWQLDVPDHEAVFPHGLFEPGEMARFLSNLSLYLVENGQVIKDGDTVDGPRGTRWQGHVSQESLLMPPRATIRWFPASIESCPEALMPAAK